MANVYDKIIGGVKRRFQRRQGDWSQEGANNTLIAMMTDRVNSEGPATIEDGLGVADDSETPGQSSSILIVAGRTDTENGNPDINQDAALLYVSAKTNVDSNIGSDGMSLGNDGDQVPDANTEGDSAVIMRSSQIRISFRQGGTVKIFLSEQKDKYILLAEDQAEIHVGKGFINVKDDKITARLEEEGNNKHIVLTPDSCDVHLDQSYVNIVSDTVVVEGSTTVKLGEGASSENVVLGTTFLKEFLQHIHQTPTGPSSPPIKILQGAVPGGVLSKKVLVEGQ